MRQQSGDRHRHGPQGRQPRRQLPQSDKIALSRSLAHAVGGVFDLLQRTAERGGLSAQLVEEMRHKALHSLPRSDTPLPLPFALRQLLSGEQAHYDHQLEMGILSTPAYVRLSQSVQDRLKMVEEGREMAELSFGPQDLSLDTDSPLELSLEMLLHLSLALEGAPASPLPELEAVRRRWLKAAHHQLDNFQRSHPTLGVAVQSDFLAHTLGASAERALLDLLESKIINATVYARASLDLTRFRQEIVDDTRHLRNLTFRDVLARIPLFATLSERELAQVESFSRRHAVKAGTVLFREGEPGNSFFVILSGILEVQSPAESGSPRMFAGSFLGELSLLFETPRTATVMALVDCDVVEIERLLFSQLQALSPPFREHVRKIAQERAEKAGLR